MKLKFIKKWKHVFYWEYALIKIPDSDNDSHILLHFHVILGIFGKMTLHCVKNYCDEFLAQFSADSLCVSSWFATSFT